MTLLQNKRARQEYSFIKEFSAGIELLGHEVKSLRRGGGNLRGAHVIVRGGEAFLVGASIAPYQPKNISEDYDQKRPRRLLLTKKEIRELAQAEDQKGLTIVPVSLYNKGRFLKLSLAIARGRKKSDKRELLKEREEKRKIMRTLKTKY